MLYLLSLISLYHISINVENYDSHFTKFPQFQYSFKKNAKYVFHFYVNRGNFIFGLATNKEIQEIEKNKNLDSYFSGLNQMSQIQFYVSYYRNSFSGEIESGGLLTPYIYLSDSQYSLSLDLEFQNGSNNLDSRIQVFGIFCIIYAFISLAILIGLFCYVTYYGYKRKLLPCQENYCFWVTKSCHCDSYYFFILNLGCIFLSYALQDYGMASFFEDQKDNEFFEVINDNSSDETIELTAKSVCYHIFVLLCMYLFSFYCYKRNLGCRSITFFFIYLFVALIMIIYCLATPYNIFMEIVHIIVFLIYALINIIYMRDFPITRIGMSLYYIGSFVAFNIGHILAYKASDKCSIHIIALIVASILIIFKFVSMVLYLLAIFYFHEFDDDKLIVIFNIQDPIQAQVPIYHREDSYTFFLHEEVRVAIPNGQNNNETNFDSTISDSSIASNIKDSNNTIV